MYVVLFQAKSLKTGCSFMRNKSVNTKKVLSLKTFSGSSSDATSC